MVETRFFRFCRHISKIILSLVAWNPFKTLPVCCRSFPQISFFALLWNMPFKGSTTLRSITQRHQQFVWFYCGTWDAKNPNMLSNFTLSYGFEFIVSMWIVSYSLNSIFISVQILTWTSQIKSWSWCTWPAYFTAWENTHHREERREENLT